MSRSRFVTHFCLLIGALIFLLPLYFIFAASIHSLQQLYGKGWSESYHYFFNQAIFHLLINSFVIALLIAAGKIIVAFLSAYALIYFKIAFRKTVFFLIFLTLMLPVEIRIVPTFQVMLGLHLVDTIAGLTLPLLASATATFLFCQCFLTISDTLIDMAKIDGAGPLRFLWHVVLPLSKTNFIALFALMFIYGWNQYLWLLVATSSVKISTIIGGVQKFFMVANPVPEWALIMPMLMLAILPPIIVVFLMRHWLSKWCIEFLRSMRR